MKLRKIASLISAITLISSSNIALIYAQQNSETTLNATKGVEIMSNSQKAFEHLKNTNIIKTKRLSLSKPTVKEIEILAKIYSDEDVNKNFPGGIVLKIDKDTAISILGNPSENEVRFIIKNQDNVIVGSAECIFIEKDNIMEIGGFISKDFWGNEYIEEANFALWQKLREMSTDFTVSLSTAEFNDKSKKAIEKGLKILHKMGISYSIEEGFVNVSVEIIPIDNSEDIILKCFIDGTEIYQKIRSKNIVKWNTLKDNKFDMKSVNYKITTSQKEKNWSSM